MLGFYPTASQPIGSNGLVNAYALLANNGVYSTTGQSAAISRSRMVLAGNGSYQTTGQSATLLRSKALTGDFGAYTTTGVPAVITYSGGPSPIVVTDQLLITLRSFTERRRF